MEEVKRQLQQLNESTSQTQAEHARLLGEIAAEMRIFSSHLKRLTGTVSSTNMIFAAVPKIGRAHV